ncbi:hypothetical protein NicSoilB4_31730 [Arthrobacter sp. NicSoilB4]|uniref:DUF998 domain-containing protein n=1 Tax=Arthrobacter sp. NicSoilB4 TaxID=2830997 RepID=UPI001CC431D7|nr:DUF998 domain-containing protein [Arthrobacter sp. NicSoilB4]BCW68410.1 hypothetical protein NicSoilB4_31730 [Arthrobacter sp. NicSoilB4]
MTADSQTLAALAACYSLGAVAVSILLVVALHKLEPEFDPSWRMLSEYSLGKYGVLMRMAFILGGTAVAASGVALWPPAGFLAVGLPVVALGPIGAVFVDTDPITTPRPEITGRSKVHAGLGSLFILGFPFAATCAGIGAATHSPAGQILAWAAIIPWAGLAWFLGATFRFGQSDSVGKPEVRIGWPNRFNMLAYLAWVTLACGLTLIQAL